MSNYVQMSEAAATARKSYLDYQTRVWGYFGAIMNGLIQCCGVPQEHIVHLKWNGLEGHGGRFTEDGGHYTLPGAITYDSRDNSFNLGVRIYLTPANHMPRQFVSFGLWISEKNGVPSIRVGRDEKPKLVNLKDELARNVFCEEMAQGIVEMFALPPKENQKTIGFEISPLGS